MQSFQGFAFANEFLWSMNIVDRESWTHSLTWRDDRIDFVVALWYPCVQILVDPGWLSSSTMLSTISWRVSLTRPIHFHEPALYWSPSGHRSHNTKARTYSADLEVMTRSKDGRRLVSSPCLCHPCFPAWFLVVSLVELNILLQFNHSLRRTKLPSLRQNTVR